MGAEIVIFIAAMAILQISGAPATLALLPLLLASTCY